jgi:phosphoglucosamine mutase
MGNLFGTDGVRALANLELTPDLAMSIARAAAALIAPHKQRARFLIGRDTRLSGDLLEAAAVAGLCSGGADAVLGGVVPSPAVAYLVGCLKLDGGIMISASHNPYEYNGLKFFGPGGGKLSDEQEARIEALAAQCGPSGAGQSVGRVVREEGLVERYVDRLTGLAHSRLQGLRVVADCGHGALHELAPRVLGSLGADVVAINCSPTGTNINQGGALEPQAVAQAVRQQGADAGVAFDGDGDRAILIDEQGQVVDGDQILAIWASDLQARGQLATNVVVGTVTTNGGLEGFLESIGCRFVRAAVGDRYVSDEMQRRGAILGGETCGHTIFAPHLLSADGLLSGATVLGLVAHAGKPLSVLASMIRKRPQITINVPVVRRGEWQADITVREAVWQAQRSLRGAGRLVVRASGTEPVIRITAECDDEHQARDIAQQIARVVAERMGAKKQFRDAQPARFL